MQKRIGEARAKLGWYFDFPGFEKNYWWDKPDLKTQFDAPKRSGRSKSNGDFATNLRPAMAWEVLRRHPHTRELLNSLPVTEENEVPIQITKYFAEGPARIFAVLLSIYGLQSWISLGTVAQRTIRRALSGRSRDNRLSASKSPNRSFRINPVRDLFLEALDKVLYTFTPEHRPGTPAVVWKRKLKYAIPTKGDGRNYPSETIKNELWDEIFKLISKTANEGYEIMTIAVDPRSTSSAEVKRRVGEMYEERFGDLPSPRVRDSQLDIIRKFEQGELIRKNAYRRSTHDLRPYRELIQQYSKAYGFPDPLGKDHPKKLRQ